MKKIAPLLLLSLWILVGFAQHNEKTLGLTMGFLKFGGPSAVTFSTVHVNSTDPARSYTNDQYGRFANPGAGAFFTFRHFAKSGYLWGLCFRAEILKNKVKLLNLYSSNTNNMYEGKTVFTSKSANIAFHTGYRFTVNKVIAIDVAPNLEFCFFLFPNHEKGKASFLNSNQTITTDRDRDRPKMDIRTGIQADTKWRNYLFTLGYTIGHRNYYEGYVGGNSEAYSRLFRIGIGYTLRK